MTGKSPDKNPLVFISTGDLSGDMHASHLVERMRGEWKINHPDNPEIKFVAAGSSHLESVGVELWEDTTYWGAMGIFEGIKILPRLLAAKRRVIKRIRDERPDLVICVDYRSFNMSLLKDIRYLPDGTRQKTAYYVSPVLWWTPSETNERKAMGRAVDVLRKVPGAAKKGIRDRFEALSELVDLALVAYPFSLDAYERAGVNYKYIGHPMGQIAVEEAKKEKYISRFREQIEGKRLVCIAPGSRLHELKYHIPILKELILKLKHRYDDLWFYCPIPNPSIGRLIQDGFGEVAGEITFVPDDCYDLMAESDLMVVKSGTSVQLALLLCVPAVSFYKIASEFMVNIGRKFFQELPFYTFPNLLAGREVVPELIQSRFTLPNIYVACTELLDDDAVAGHMRSELVDLRKKTMKEDPIGEASRELCRLLAGGD